MRIRGGASCLSCFPVQRVPASELLQLVLGGGIFRIWSWRISFGHGRQHSFALVSRQDTFGPALDEAVVMWQQARAVPVPGKLRELAVGHVYLKRGEDGVVLKRLDARAAGEVGILAPHHLDLEEPSIGGAIHPTERVAMKSEILADASDEARGRGVVADATDHARDGDLARAEIVGIAEFWNIDDDIAAIQPLQPGPAASG